MITICPCCSNHCEALEFGVSIGFFNRLVQLPLVQLPLVQLPVAPMEIVILIVVSTAVWFPDLKLKEGVHMKQGYIGL